MPSALVTEPWREAAVKAPLLRREDEREPPPRGAASRPARYDARDASKYPASAAPGSLVTPPADSSQATCTSTIRVLLTVKALCT